MSKDAMDIEGLGKSIVEHFFRMGWLPNPTGHLPAALRAIEMEDFGAKSVANLRASVEKMTKLHASAFA
ncbi:MAG: hypothetical protein IPJ00_19105 [Saprospirales bacterium]|nr:hypothetical protein [Saprospirales bacterium]